MTRKKIALHHRLIFALDVTTKSEALKFVETLDGLVSFYKIGWALFLAEGPAMVAEVLQRGHRVFLDLKLPDDIPDQISRTVAYAANMGVDFMTMNATGKTLSVAKEAKKNSTMQLLSVTALTSLNEEDLRELGEIGLDKPIHTLDDFVVSKARYSLTHGSDGLISSGASAAVLREKIGENPIIVCPGIRPLGENPHDQKRIVTPTEAINNGADYLVVGRPIRNSLEPRAAAQNIMDEINNAIS